MADVPYKIKTISLIFSDMENAEKAAVHLSIDPVPPDDFDLTKCRQACLSSVLNVLDMLVESGIGHRVTDTGEAIVEEKKEETGIGTIPFPTTGTLQ